MAEALAERATRRGQGACAAGLGRQRQDGAVAARPHAGGGVEVERYHPCTVPHRADEQRTHRKLLVVDGRIGGLPVASVSRPVAGEAQDPNTGATCISASRPRSWRRCRPPSWTTDQDHRQGVAGEEYFAGARAADGHAGADFSSSPTGGSESMQLIYLMSIAARRAASTSRRRISSRHAGDRGLIAAAKRGVRVRVIVPVEHSTPTPCAGLARRSGASCSPRASRSTSINRRCITARR